MDSKEARQANLKALIRKHGSIEELAKLTESSPRHVSQMNNGTRKMGDKVARRFEAKLGYSHGWMDVLQHQAPQGSLHTEKLVDDFGQLPSALQEYVGHVAAELRELIDSVPDNLRPLISAPPKDPERYQEWENSIRALIATARRKPS